MSTHAVRARVVAFTQVACVALTACVAACSHDAPEARAAAPRPPSAPEGSARSAASSVDVPGVPAPGTLRRSAVQRAVAGGLGAFLGRIALDDRPVLEGGRFHGFRVVALKGDPTFWRDVDLRPGDVVTRVNGMAIEHPEEALEVFRSLDVASELRVDVERDGAARPLRFVIVDDVPVARPDGGAPRPRPL